MKVLAIVAVALLACTSPTSTHDATKPAGATPAATAATAAAPGPAERPGFYMGRPIAPTMSHEGADWLTRPERESEEHASRMLAELGLHHGDVACDLGAGNGFHTLEMAKRVAPQGRAIAVDIQPEMLRLLEARAKAAGVNNVETVLGEPADPKLPKGGCDLVLLADVYHELDDPAGMLAKIGEALSTKGRLALLEFKAEDRTVPIKPEHTMSRAQILKELTANGYTLARSFDELPWQHLMFFARTAPR